MKISIILAHPDPASLNHAIARTAKAGLRANGHDVILHDLYAERFDPILNSSEISETGPVPPEIERYGTEISSADGIVIVHPNWWGQPPAILKGWIDRVLRPGVAYRFLEGDTGEGLPIGLQLVGRPGEDSRVLTVAAALERRLGVGASPGTHALA